MSSSAESRCIEKCGTGSIIRLSDRTNGAIVERVISGDATAEGNRMEDGDRVAGGRLRTCSEYSTNVEFEDSIETVGIKGLRGREPVE